MMRLHILIIDDDPDDRDMFCEVVRTLDFNVECTWQKNGSEALELLNNKGTVLPDLIFLDLNMPRLNGKQCLSLLKASDKLARIPVVVYTTSKLQKDIDETFKLGAASFLTKPDSLQDLKKSLTEIIKAHCNCAPIPQKNKTNTSPRNKD